MKKIFMTAAASAAAISLLFAGCTAQPGGGYSYFVQLDIARSDLRVDGEIVSVSEYRELMEDLESLMNGLEEDFSVEFSDSDLSRVNTAVAGESVALSAETKKLFALAEDYSDLTGGKFSPALYPLTTLWGFSPENAGRYGVSRAEPSESALSSARALSDLSLFSVEEGCATKKADGAMLDFGGIAKGYMCDRAVEYLRSRFEGQEIDAIVNVSSSNTALLGKKREEGGVSRGYNVGIENSRALTTGTGTGLYLVGLSDVSVTTSADNYRCYVYGGKIYPHIIDPETGKPADRGIISVTIVVPNDGYLYSGALADALSTAAFCMPLTRSLAFLQELSDEWEGFGAVVITEDFKYYGVGGVNVMNRTEYAAYCNEILGTDYDLSAIEDVFEKGDVSSAVDEVQPCEEERIYIARLEELSG